MKTPPVEEADRDAHGKALAESHKHSHEDSDKDHSTGLTSCEHDVGMSPQLRLGLVVCSGVLTGIGLLLQWMKFGPQLLPPVIFALATLAGGALVAPAAWQALRKRKLDMNVLMVVAVAGAWLIGEHAEGATVVFLFALSELLELWAGRRAGRAIAALLDLAPDEAIRLLPGGKTEVVPVAAVVEGDLIAVRSGERIPLDGEVFAGNSAVNQAPITGESVPVEKTKGDAVYAGTINGEGSLQVRVTKIASNSTLARIIRLVEEASRQKAPAQRFIDRFASIYTPAVFVVAALAAVLPPLLMGGAWMEWGYRALVLLVIACPCALVIATPVSIVSGITALARRGVLVKGGAALEAVGKLRALAVDKTGTITEGKPRVIEVLPHGPVSEEEILRLSASIDAHSTHPLALAVVTAAKDRGLTYPESTDYQSLTARGAKAVVEGHLYFIGNHKLTHELGACSPDIESKLTEIQSRGLSVAVLGHAPHEGCVAKAIGILAIGDAIRPEAKEALAMLHASGIEKVVMLSGDNQRTVNAIAQQAGIDEAIGDLMPEQKVSHLKLLRSRFHDVGMTGDGVNDAPALAVATVGIAMGAIGSDTAIETADAALMNDDLRQLATAIRTGKRTMGIVRFNVGFALAVKALFLILAFTGHTSLWMAILADTGATLLVIANAMRLLKIK